MPRRLRTVAIIPTRGGAELDFGDKRVLTERWQEGRQRVRP